MNEIDSTTPPLKTCTKCGDEKPLEAFSRQSANPDGLRARCKACSADASAAYNAAYRAAHREQCSAYRVQHVEERAASWAAWYAENREKKLAYDSAYYAAHREEKAARGAAYYAAHREERAACRVAYNLEHRADKAAYYAAHTEEYAAYCRAHRAAHPESVRAGNHNRRARKRGNGGTHTAADIRVQYARQNGRCFYCDAKVGDSYHVDHVMPLILGGSNGPENLAVSCPTCNLSKGAKHPMDFAGRLL